MYPVINPTMAGMIETVRHAVSEDIPSLKRGKRAEPMTSWVTPPPRLPHPPTIAFAVPATSLVNMEVVQYWHMTKVDPPRPMKKRVAARVAAELTRPIQAQGIDAAIKTIPIRIRAPNLSQRGPRTKRMTIVPATEQMLEVQMSCLVILRSSLTSVSRGAMANQMKKAMKKQNQEQWKARM